MTKKMLLSALAAAALVVPLTACTGGAQNIDAAGEEPGSTTERTDAGQQDDLPCTRVDASALESLQSEVDDDPVQLGYGVQAGDLWYVAAPIGESNVLSDEVGLWTTTGDISADEFDGSWTALNEDARTASSSSAQASGEADEDSDEAERALSCIEDAGDEAR
ncbi:hypothetical protein [Frigoribacterium salinisoli]